MKPHPLVAGIDLGTTNSAIAVVIDGGLTVIPVAGQPTMPSAVGLNPAGKLIIGQAAKNQQISSPENTILSIKRHMGTAHAATLGGKSYTPEEISALILGELKRAAEAHLGQPVTQAVITVPAFFNEAQRKATQAAGALAGLEVLRIINEPTAAALAYGAGDPDGDREGETMLVYDLGGGTFDVSLVRVEKGIVEVKASHGDTRLGGDDFDDALVQLAADRFAAQDGAPDLPDAARRRLKGIMEQAKIQLSSDPFVNVREDYLAGQHHLITEIARADYEDLIASWLEKTIDCVRRALTDAGVTARQVDKIMLVGGATRTPVVHDLLRANLGKTPHHEINPDLIVAMGAAIQGAALAGAPSPAILIDITAHTYSTSIWDGMSLISSPIIPRGTPLPVRRSEVYFTCQENQEKVIITVHQGEGRYPDQNTLLGEFVLTDLVPQPVNSPVIIQFQLDLNGLLTATGIEKKTGRAEALTIDTHGQHRLNLDAARANLAALFTDESLEDDDDAADDGLWEEDPDASGADPAGETISGNSTATATAPAGLLASAKTLRQRAEALIARGISDKDAADLDANLKATAEAINSRSWPALQSLTENLSDILFDLED
jgi:molecular chaperone DnaK